MILRQINSTPRVLLQLLRLLQLLQLLQLIALTATSNVTSGSREEELLSRQKRLIYFTTDRRFALPPGSVLSFVGEISIPFQRGMPNGYASATNLELPLTLDLDALQWTSDQNPLFYLPFEDLGKRKKRQLKYGGDRTLFYQILEDFLTNLGMRGQACLLRAICETHELPFYEHGFLGEVLRLLLTASLAYDMPESMDVYVEAEKLGSHFHNCSRYKEQCPHTLYSDRPAPNSRHSSNERQGRFLYFTTDRRLTMPFGTNGVAYVSLGINNFRGAYAGTSLSMSITTTLGLNFDALGLTAEENPFFDLTPLGLSRKKRGAPANLPIVNTAGGDRELMYPAVEKYIESFDLNGTACLLRAICEVQEKPIRNYNVLGEIIEIFLKPTRAPRPEERLREYVRAERAGRLDGDCSPYFPNCPKSLFRDEPAYSVPLTPETEEYLRDFLSDEEYQNLEAM